MLTDYNNSILNLTNSVLKYYNCPTFHPTLPVLDDHLRERKENIILFIMDGMGNEYLEKFHKDGILLKHRKQVITSVYPCTTTSAIKCYESGLSPLEHGNLGWTLYFKETNRFINILPYRNDDTLEKLNDDEFNYRKLMGYETIFDHIDKNSPDVEKHVIYPDFIVNGFKNTTYHGYTDYADLCEKISALAHQKGQKFIYVYCDNPDALMHEHGPSGEIVHDYMKMVQSNIEKLFDKLKDTSSTLIISADHGQIDVEEYINIYEDEELMKMIKVRPFIEGRCCSFIIKRGNKRKFRQYFNEKYGEYYLLLTKDEFILNGYLGTGVPHKKIDDLIPDYVALAKTRKTFQVKKTSYILKGHHAGLCKEENEVPLIVYSI